MNGPGIAPGPFFISRRVLPQLLFREQAPLALR